MSDEPITRDSPARKFLKAIAWAYVIMTLVGAFTGLLDRVVRGPFGTLVPYSGVALVMLAYRRPGLKGRVFMLSLIPVDKRHLSRGDAAKQ
ncbi:MAG TPA: hypothetical protein VG055_12740 [Planctomycetaceae bacterium]|jgi:hypothetical protein|nr:hypothetical protein [Planctomycetaceae bacterium]